MASLDALIMHQHQELLILPKKGEGHNYTLLVRCYPKVDCLTQKNYLRFGSYGEWMTRLSLMHKICKPSVSYLIYSKPLLHYANICC